jgi:hypothetical protein
MEEEGEEPVFLRVELATDEEADIFAAKVQLIGGFALKQSGSTLIVRERD